MKTIKVKEHLSESLYREVLLGEVEAIDTAVNMLLWVLPGGVNDVRKEKLIDLMSVMDADELSRLRLTVCGDEGTGTRFGNRLCRVDQCLKIGRSTYKYQIWADWS